MEKILEKIKTDPRYAEGITYGKPRKGHAEGTVEKHIEQLEVTLNRLDHLGLITFSEYFKLQILIHTHDTFKLEGKRLTGHQVSIRHPQSHASLAKKFLSKFTDDPDILSIAQFHAQISNIELYLIFTFIDVYTQSKLEDRSPRWFIDEVNKHAITPRVYKILEAFEL
jgi:hypothetical protein